MIGYKYLIPVIIIVSTIAFGTIGFMTVEHLSLFDAFYLTILTITTVGYGDIVPTTHLGKALALFISVLGIGTIITTLPIILLPMFEESFKKVIRGMERIRFKNHVIICGYNNLVDYLIKSLEEKKVQYIIVENDSQMVSKIVEKNLPVIKGDASNEKVLEAAGIKHARALVSATSNDADDVLITMTARGLRKDLKIIAEANEERNIEKLKKAGANAVFSPPVVVGEILASEALKSY